MAASLKHSYGNKEYSFVNKDVSKFVCAICQEILYEPVQTSCGHLFCGRCLKRIRSKKCPSCRAEFVREPIEDKFNEREIRNLIVKCQNSSRGCEWEGELGNVESHQNGVCGYQLVQCGNKCGAEIERRDVEKHEKDHCELRMYECPYCTTVFSLWSNKYIGTYKKVTSEHFKECYGFLLDCPNNCGGKEIRRGDMSSHLCACPEEVVPCRYQSLGCKVRLPRKHMGDHLKDKDGHLDIAMTTTAELTSKVSEHSEMINTLQKLVHVLLKKTSTEVELPPPVPPSKPWLKEDLFPHYPPCTLRVELDENGCGVTPHFFSNPGGYKLQFWTDGYGVDIYPVDHPDNYPLKWPIKITVNYVFLNQEEDKDHDHGEYSGQFTSPKGTQSSFYDFDYDDGDGEELPQEFINSIYIKITSVDVQ